MDQILLTCHFGKYPHYWRVFDIPGGTGFLPSTVAPENVWLEDCFVSFWGKTAYFRQKNSLLVSGRVVVKANKNWQQKSQMTPCIDEIPWTSAKKIGWYTISYIATNLNVQWGTSDFMILHGFTLSSCSFYLWPLVYILVQKSRPPFHLTNFFRYN